MCKIQYRKPLENGEREREVVRRAVKFPNPTKEGIRLSPSTKLFIAKQGAAGKDLTSI